MFHSKDYLKATALMLQIKPGDMNTIEKCWRCMSENDTNALRVPPTKEEGRNKAVKMLLTQSFQTPFTGSKKVACEMGHKNEPLLIKALVLNVNRGTDDNGREFKLTGVEKILGIYQTGLVAKKGKMYIKDSIDFIAVVLLSNGNVDVWGGEVKTRTTQLQKTIENNFQQKRFNQQGNDLPTCTEFECDSLHSEVNHIEERTQLLHHACVYGFKNIIFIIGDWNAKIIHLDVVKFNLIVLDEYESVLDAAFEDTLKWAYPTLMDGHEIVDLETGTNTEVETLSNSDSPDVPEYVIDAANNIPQIGGEHEILSTLFLWMKMTLDVILNGPLPELKRIIPKQHSAWNGIKPPGDTITKLIESLPILHPCINFETRATTRFIQYAFVVINRLQQVKSAKIENHSSLLNYRDSATKRYTFLKTMTICFKTFVSMQSTSATQLMNQEHVPIPIEDALVNKRPQKRSSDGTRFSAIPSPYTAPYTKLTPTKKGKQKTGRTSSDAFSKRFKTCVGHPVKLLRDARQRCARCNNKTNWMCHNCHLFFCHTPKLNIETAKEKGVRIYAVADPRNQCGDNEKKTYPDLYYFDSCFLIEHPTIKEMHKVSRSMDFSDE